MKLIALALLLATTAEAQRAYPLALPRGCRNRSCVRGRVVQSAAAYAFFEFAPLSGAGMGAACACTTPTGAKGEAMTFTRASSATCLKTVGTAPQSIANGDLVTCTSGQPRVMPGSDGTSINGLLVEEARTNLALQSEAFDNVAWAKTSIGVAVPTVTANAAIAPDGSLTAERVQFPAVTSAQISLLDQSLNCGTTGIGSVFIMGNGGSGTIRGYVYNNSSVTTGSCNYVSTGWTQCLFGPGGATADFAFGTDGSHFGSSQGAQDVFVWGGQCETASSASSYIKTTSAAVTRVAEVASFLLTLAGGTASFAATYSAPSSLGSNALMHIYKDSNNSLELSVASSKARGTFRQSGTSSTQDSTGSLTASASNRLAAYYDLTNKAGCLTGTCSTASASLTLETGSNTLYLGADQAGANAIDGLIGQVCYDPSGSRCR